MNEDRVVGTARNLGGKAQEGFGRVTGDTKSQVEGVINQATGAAQDFYGQAKETASDAAQGYADGQFGRLSQCPANLDSFSYSSGYCEGRACRGGRPQRSCSLANPDSP